MSQPNLEEIMDTEDISRDEAIEKLRNRTEWLQDMDNLKPQSHNWVDRGLIISCEGAGHPHHQTSRMM
jgi:hypothetical protein